MSWENREYNRDNGDNIPPVQFRFPPITRLTGILIAVNLGLFLLKIFGRPYDELLRWGALEYGAGTGWQRHEYEASGQSFASRSDFLFDQMRACRELWHEWPASFSGSHFSFKDIWCSPRLPGAKAQSPLKLWFGLAPTAANARFFAEFPDAGWSCLDPDLDLHWHPSCRRRCAVSNAATTMPPTTRLTVRGA